MLFQKRDSKSFDAVALHRGQNEDLELTTNGKDNKVHYQSLDDELMAIKAGVNGDDGEKVGETIPPTALAAGTTAEPNQPSEVWLKFRVKLSESYLTRWHSMLLFCNLFLNVVADLDTHTQILRIFPNFSLICRFQHKTTLGEAEIQSAVEAAAVIFKKVVLQRRQAAKKNSDDGECGLN